MLHPLGELDHHLKPKSRVAELEDEDDEETEEGGKPKTGTKKRRSSISQAQWIYDLIYYCSEITESNSK